MRVEWLLLLLAGDVVARDVRPPVPLDDEAEDEDEDEDEDESAEKWAYTEFWELMNMTMDEVHHQFGSREPKYPTPPRQSRVDHFIVLYMENHAADHYFGCMGLEGFDGIDPEKGHSFPKDPANASAGIVNVICGNATYVCDGGPGYATFDGKFGAEPGHDPHKYPYSPQSDANSGLHGASDGGLAVHLFGPEQIPIKRTIASEFGVFNKLYTATPTASSPNHLFTQSGTSCGMVANALYDDCGGNTSTFPQDTIYDRLREHNVSFGLFINSTCGLDGTPCHGVSQDDPNSASAISTPDVAMEGVARHKDMFFSQEVFYDRAANGTLPGFSWLHPPIEACDHPCNDIAKGERLLKDVYEAIRAGPNWNTTLLFVVYDDTGGYYDHVVPPSEGVPADDHPCNVRNDSMPKCGGAFDFRRLGLRSAAMLIGPMVPKGAVFQEPKEGPFNTSQFDETSILHTTKNLFNLSSYLTKRDAWSGNFEELLLDEPRGDCPLHLPTPPPAKDPWGPPPATRTATRATARRPTASPSRPAARRRRSPASRPARSASSRASPERRPPTTRTLRPRTPGSRPPGARGSRPRRRCISFAAVSSISFAAVSPISPMSPAGDFPTDPGGRTPWN